MRSFYLAVLAVLVIGCVSNPPSSSSLEPVAATPLPTPSVLATPFSTPGATPNPCRAFSGDAKSACYLDLAKQSSDYTWCFQIPDDARADQLECSWTLAYRLQDARACKWLTQYQRECQALAAHDVSLCDAVPEESARQDCRALFEQLSALEADDSS